MAKTYAKRAWRVLGLLVWFSAAQAAADKTKDWYESEGADDEEDEDASEAGDERDDDEDGAHDEFDGPEEEQEEEDDLDFRERGTYLTPGTLSLYVGTLVGFGGKYEVDTNTPLDVEDDLAPTWGLQLGVDFVIHKIFALGGEFRTLGVILKSAADLNGDRDLYLDFVVKPRLRHVFESSGVEIYGTLPVGLTLPILANPNGIDTTVGMNLGVGAGASYFFTSHWGVSSDLVWLYHRYNAERPNVSSGGVEEGTISFQQVTLLANLVYAL